MTVMAFGIVAHSYDIVMVIECALGRKSSFARVGEPVPNSLRVRALQSIMNEYDSSR